MATMQTTLALWIDGILTDEQVVQWADQEILSNDIANDQVIELSLNGPRKFLNQAQLLFKVYPPQLRWSERFSLWAVKVDLSSDDSVKKFRDWVLKTIFSADISLTEDGDFYSFGIMIDHFLIDCKDADKANDFIRKNLPLLLPECKQTIAQMNYQL
jgi:hypothetical protein